LIKILKVNAELGAGTRGASLGPNTIEITASKNKSTLFSDVEVENLNF